MNIRVSIAGALPAALRIAGKTPGERRTHPGRRRKHQAAVAMPAKREFTFASVGEQRRRVALLERHGYRVVSRRLGYLVLHAGSTQASADTSRRPAG